MTNNITRFLSEQRPDSPCLVVDLEAVEAHYRALAAGLPRAEIYYAIKANPAREILMRLLPLGSRFDAASIYEIRQCLAAGVPPESISFGNTIKKESAIRAAFDAGIRLFAFDCDSEADKISRSAPGSSVFCRFLTSGAGADWPLSNKFGVAPDRVVETLRYARDKGLKPVGVSFHVGSQQRDIRQWDRAIAQAAALFREAAEAGVALELLNIGGGFPSRYREGVPPLDESCDAINDAIARHFGKEVPRIIAEPGRYISGDAGVIETEIVLVSRKRDGGRRWIYLDIGKFGGLIETLEEAIKYRIETPYENAETGPVVLAGPTCDEMDVLYDEAGYELPLDLKEGDRIRILSAGAYTASYSSTGFNGFPPLREYYI